MLPDCFSQTPLFTTEAPVKSGGGCVFETASQPPVLCAQCGEDIGEYAFETEQNLFMCEDCFRQWAQDYLKTNPRECADALGVPWYYLF